MGCTLRQNAPHPRHERTVDVGVCRHVGLVLPLQHSALRFTEVVILTFLILFLPPEGCNLRHLLRCLGLRFIRVGLGECTSGGKVGAFFQR